MDTESKVYAWGWAVAGAILIALAVYDLTAGNSDPFWDYLNIGCGLFFIALTGFILQNSKAGNEGSRRVSIYRVHSSPTVRPRSRKNRNSRNG